MDPKKYIKMEEEESLSDTSGELDAVSLIDRLMDALGVSPEKRDEAEAAFVAAVQAIQDGKIPTEEG